jgi:phosphoglycolate phosphatase-like HAD superfamily hydrolase
VNATRFDLVVFDFDGTLVQSAQAKRRAFFDIFPESCAPAVEAVLTRDPDGSRHVVIPAMIDEAAARGLDAANLKSQELIAAFARQVAVSVASAAEVPGAVEALRRASERAAAYIFSMTPHDELVAQIERRGWTDMVRQAWGFPNRKPEVLAMLLARHACPKERALVVGDGVSDGQAAQENGCAFLKAEPGWPSHLMRELGA